LEYAGLEESYDDYHDGYRFRFFFSKNPDHVDIWWVSEYQDFINTEEEIPQNRLYFATLLISNNEIIYAVSLGKSHFYLSSLCDRDFGLNLAERILDEDELKIKHSKYYKSNKKKSITSFGDGSELVYDAGESMHFIKGKTIDEDTWGKSVSFGHSVHLKIDVPPIELGGLINTIEEALYQPPITSIPKVEIITDEISIMNLDRKLSSAIYAESDPNLNIEEFTVSGVNFIFTDNYTYSLYIARNSRNKYPLSSLTTQEILNFVEQEQISLQNNINNIKVSVHREEGRSFSKPLKYFLDFIDDTDRNCLIDGNWFRFNQSYVQYLREEVDKIELSYDRRFDIESSVIEATFNEDRENDGYINYDTELSSIDNKYRVEKMDLYKENSLYFVKKGTPQKLSYVVDQAITTVKILQQNASTIEIGNEEVNIRKISIWIIMPRVRNISRISDINSLIFHIKLSEWRKLCIDAGYEPEIKINYSR
jgi:uncharacterized protein (TIGR04141 family)